MRMTDFPMVREWIAEGAKKSLREFLEARFNTFPETIRTTLEKVTVESQLSELTRFAATCPDLESFQKKLEEILARPIPEEDEYPEEDED